MLVVASLCETGGTGKGHTGTICLQQIHFVKLVEQNRQLALTEVLEITLAVSDECLDYKLCSNYEIISNSETEDGSCDSVKPLWVHFDRENMKQKADLLF